MKHQKREALASLFLSFSCFDVVNRLNLPRISPQEWSLSTSSGVKFIASFHHFVCTKGNCPFSSIQVVGTRNFSFFPSSPVVVTLPTITWSRMRCSECSLEHLKTCIYHNHGSPRQYPSVLHRSLDVRPWPAVSGWIYPRHFWAHAFLPWCPSLLARHQIHYRRCFIAACATWHQHTSLLHLSVVFIHGRMKACLWSLWCSIPLLC